MIRKILLVAVALVALMATPAAAQYPGLTVNPGTVRPGGNADFAGKGCQAGETVVIRLDGTVVSTVTSDTSGEFSGSFVVPAGTSAGVHTVTSTCGSLVQTAQVTVLGTAVTPPRTGSGTLPRTGSEVNTMGLFGAGLLAAGGAVMLATRMGGVACSFLSLGGAPAVWRGLLRVLDPVDSLLTMRVAVAGSSGLVGTALVEALDHAGHDVVRIVRRPASGPHELTWDPAGATLDREGLRGVDAVVNLAGEGIGSGPWTDARRARLRDSRVDGTTLLAEAIADLDDGPRVLVNASAIGFYGDRGDEVLTEASPPGDDFLARLCVDWEAATAPATEAGARVVLIRTGIVLARHGGALAKQIPLFKAALGGRAGDGTQWLSWITLDDEVAVILRALTDDALAGPVNATAPNPVTNQAFTGALARALHRPAVIRVPRFVRKLPLGLGSLLDSLLFSSTRVQPAALAEVGFEFAHPELDAALAAVLAR